MIRRIVDIHAHIFPDKIVEKAIESISKYYGIGMCCKGTVKDLLKNGDKAGIQKYIVHSTATRKEQVSIINDFIAEAKNESNKLIGFGTLHPDMVNVSSEIDRVISMGLKGIKLHPEFQAFSIDDECMLPIFAAIEGRLPLLIHMGDENRKTSSPDKLARVLLKFPNLTIIAAHFGGYSMWDESKKFLVGKKVYFDTSSSLFKLDSSHAVEIIRAHGANKILFGTDYPMWLPEEELERFDKLILTENERELILWKNATELLDINWN